MTLKMTTKTVYDVEDWDFEQFVAEHGGTMYSFQADQEVGDDATVEFTVDGQVDQFEKEEVDEVLGGGHEYFVTGALLNHFANLGLIPFGNYLIHTR